MGACPDRARCPSGTLHVFHYFQHCFSSYFARNVGPICMNVEKHTDLPSFFRSRLPVKTMCSIDAYDENLKFENLQNVNFGGSKIGPDALIRDPSPARAGTSRGGGCQFLQPAAAPSSVSKSTMAVGTCLLGPRATCGRASCVSLLKSSENEILRGGTPRL